MREISGSKEPNELTEWKRSTPGVGYSQMPSDLRKALKCALIAEQRGLCAYTGLHVTMDRSHIEHLIPQAHCSSGQDLAYTNMVACFPAPGESAPFGAVLKDNWPSPAEEKMFVSPRSSSCEKRFAFSLRGGIDSSNNSDLAAVETIQKLGLDHSALRRYRKEAIDATLQVRGSGPASLNLKLARRRLAGLLQSESSRGSLEQFCFVLKQALELHIRRLEAIARSKHQRL